MKLRVIGVLLLVGLVLGVSGVAFASSSYKTQFNNRYGTAGSAIDQCSLCHTTAPSLNPYGTAFLNSGYDFAAIESLDSDSDGFTNIAEITARTFPGDPNSKPAGSDTTLPTVSSFTIPATSTSLTVPITSFAATDNVGVTGYLVNESATKPAASAAGWTATAPTSYTAATAGAKTLYAWAKDAAGNVSNSRSASVTITLPDTTLPTVSSFTIPATSTSLTVPITSFTATDNVGVTGYLVNESATKPAASAAGWTATAPTSYTAATAGAKTFYAWAKDAAGNVSNSLSASVVITTTGSAGAVNIVDFDGDGKTDIAFYRSNSGAWYIHPSSGAAAYGVGWGGDPSDKPVPGDYDGDGKTDTAFYRPASGAWYISPSSGAAAYGVGWGGTGFTPVPGDYDGDGKTDVAIYSSSTGAWWIKPSSGAASYGVGWGGTGFTPVPGDYDGDGKTDIAIYNSTTGAWWIQPSSGAAAYGVGWGGTGFTAVPGDYDGDGKTDIAIYDPITGIWWVKPSSGAAAYGVGWGGDTSDKPVPGDYDGDGKDDIAVYRASTGAWYVKPSSGAATYGVGFGGGATDIPVKLNASIY